jgi:hypothetical protein
MSTLPEGISFMSSRQSPFISTCPGGDFRRELRQHHPA